LPKTSPKITEFEGTVCETKVQISPEVSDLMINPVCDTANKTAVDPTISGDSVALEDTLISVSITGVTTEKQKLKVATYTSQTRTFPSVPTNTTRNE